jgi:tetratricopeptide (TPR) repeat protein
MLLVVGAITIFSFCANGQDNAPQKETGQDVCNKECVKSVGLCHLQKALYLIHGRDTTEIECIRTELHSLDALEEVPKLLLGIKEINAAIANPLGINVELSSIKLELAGAKITLAHTFFDLGNIDDAEKAMKEAGEIYLTLFKEKKSQSIVLKVAAGLLRCGMTIDALKILKELPPTDPNRNYLMGEAFYSIGDRKNAANNYEDWIKLDCQSEAIMLLNDEYGKKWSLLLLSKPEKQSPCEQLPQELRSRLETLKQQFGHPNNLPIQSYPGTLFPTRADY